MTGTQMLTLAVVCLAAGTGGYLTPGTDALAELPMIPEAEQQAVGPSPERGAEEEQAQQSAPMRKRLDVRAEAAEAVAQGGKESLGIDIEIDNRRGDPVDFIVAFELEDGGGHAVKAPVIDQVPVKLPAQAIANRKFQTPPDLEDGAYVLRTTVASKAPTGAEDLALSEFFFLVDGGGVTPVTFDEWFPHVNEVEPVLDPADPDPEAP